MWRLLPNFESQANRNADKGRNGVVSTLAVQKSQANRNRPERRSACSATLAVQKSQANRNSECFVGTGAITLAVQKSQANRNIAQQNVHRFYKLDFQPDLLGGFSLIRE